MQIIISLVKRTVAALAFAALAFVPVWTPSAQAGVNLVQNGDFTGTLLSSPGGYICQSGTSCVSNVSDWGSACSSLGVCGNGSTPGSLLFRGTNGVAWNSGNGLYSFSDLAGYSGNYIGIDGSPSFTAPIFQTINGLTVGKTYQLSFYQAAAQQNGSAGSTTEQWVVSLGSSTQDSMLMSIPQGGFSGWSLQTEDFKATAASEVLNFAALGGGVPPVALLADVSMTAVPEPATWAMMLLGFVGLGLVGVRSARRKAVSAA